jgi:serine/threonine protein phosphatase PrpC
VKYAIVHDTRVGARALNQDRVGHWRTPASLLMVLADGMGGHLRGELAAELALEFISGAFLREARPKLANPDLFLFRAVSRAHAAILQKAQALGMPEPPRTVIVACVVQDGHAYWTHVGDCRLYFVRRGRVLARTRDHSIVQQLVDEGRIREEAVSTHPDRNRLLQCLGGFSAPQVDPTSSARLQRDDILLLCSDGFWGPLTQRQMLNAVLNRPLQQAVFELSTLAETRAGPECDNVTVLALAWQEDERGREVAETVPYYELPTEVQDFTATDPDFLRMSDEDIDKAIAELRAALRRNAGQA